MCCFEITDSIKWMKLNHLVIVYLEKLSYKKNYDDRHPGGKRTMTQSTINSRRHLFERMKSMERTHCSTTRDDSKANSLKSRRNERTSTERFRWRTVRKCATSSDTAHWMEKRWHVNSAHTWSKTVHSPSSFFFKNQWSISRRDEQVKHSLPLAPAKL